MKRNFSFLLLAFLSFSTPAILFSQDKPAYVFKDKIDIEVTPVKDQHRSGTCWSYASISFLEAELMRTGKGEFDLSEMFLVRNCYVAKAEKFVRMQGKTNFGNGGLAMDLIWVWKNYGLVPEVAYTGNNIEDAGPVHSEMDGALHAYVEEIINNKNRKLSLSWINGFKGIADAYLGTYPDNFTYKGKSFTPESFAKSLELDPDDYLFLGSYTHQPFYNPFILEIPDNWGWNEIENVKLDEMMAVLDNSLQKGYTVCWDADVSERGFNYGKGLSLIPSEKIEDLDNLEQAKWSELSDREKQAMFYDFSSPRKEMEITQEIRQAWFDDYTTTDDHLMHITGIAFDQNGTKFYKVKNSWGTENQIYQGYFYCSEAYMRAKTIFFMVHKDVVPADLAVKIGL